MAPGDRRDNPTSLVEQAVNNALAQARNEAEALLIAYSWLAGAKICRQ
ncbi:hypothetical protein [Erwinia sp. 9145]|nr:hypothetical protein [Erwinia sp. 9145]